VLTRTSAGLFKWKRKHFISF